MANQIDPARLITGHDVRQACREQAWTSPTAGLAPGFAQANLVVIPQQFADDFRRFCEANPQPCPVLEITPPGDVAPRRLAPQADLRTDLPRYRVWQDGVLVEEPFDVLAWWRDDFVSFLIGCSFTFDDALMEAGLSVRHIEEGRNVPMYRTNRPCVAAGVFRGPLVVSMRPFSNPDAARAHEITREFPHFHGAPVHAGHPAAIGIEQLDAPHFGEAVSVREEEIPVFWACGVTPQCALIEAKLPLAITHSPGHMFVTDLTNADVISGTHSR